MENRTTFEDSDDSMMMHKQLVIALSNNIYGAIIRVKEIHLNTSSQTVHEHADSICWRFAHVYDKLLETILGITDSKLEFGSIRPNLPEPTNLTQVLKILRMQVSKTKEQLPGEYCNAIHNILDEFLVDINKDIYLSVNR